MDGADAQVEPNPSATVPGRQGSVIPLGWKPTVSKPVPVVRCTVIKKDGVRCGKWSLRGHTKCKSHLRNAELNFGHVREHMDAVIEAARMRLVDDADVAIDTLEALLEVGTAEGIRLKAATEILDRVGVRGGFEVEVEVDNKIDAAQVLAKRLHTLKDRENYGKNIIEGEVIEDDDDTVQEETLF